MVMQGQDSAETPNMDPVRLVSSESSRLFLCGDDLSRAWPCSVSEQLEMKPNVPGPGNGDWFPAREELTDRGLKMDCAEQLGGLVRMDVPFAVWRDRRCPKGLKKMPHLKFYNIKIGRNEQARNSAREAKLDYEKSEKSKKSKKSDNENEDEPDGISGYVPRTGPSGSSRAPANPSRTNGNIYAPVRGPQSSQTYTPSHPTKQPLVASSKPDASASRKSQIPLSTAGASSASMSSSQSSQSAADPARPAPSPPSASNPPTLTQNFRRSTKQPLVAPSKPDASNPWKSHLPRPHQTAGRSRLSRDRQAPAEPSPTEESRSPVHRNQASKARPQRLKEADEKSLRPSLPNLNCEDASFGLHWSFFMHLFIQSERPQDESIKTFGYGNQGPAGNIIKPDAWLARIREDLRQSLEERIELAESKMTDATAHLNNLREEAKKKGIAADDNTFHITQEVYLKIKKAERARDRARIRHEETRNTHWQYVFLLAEHTESLSEDGKKGTNDWWYIGNLPSATLLREKFLQQQKCVQILLRYQPFRQFVISILVLHGYIYLVWQDRSSVEITEPLNINNSLHEKFLMDFFNSLLVEEMPELTGYGVVAETIGLNAVPRGRQESESQVGEERIETVEHRWTFKPTQDSQWEIQVEKLRETGTVTRTFVSKMDHNLPPYVLRPSLVGRNVFTCRAEEIGAAKTQDLFIKFDWSSSDIQASTHLLEGIVLSGEVDHLRLHMELDLHGKLILHESGKLCRTKGLLTGYGKETPFYGADKERVQAGELYSINNSNSAPPAVPQIAVKHQPYVQRQACIVITDYTKTFETKFREEPRVAGEAFPYWIFGAIAFSLLVYETTGFIQGDFNFQNLRCNDKDQGDYKLMQDYVTAMGDWDLAEAMMPADRLNKAHSGTPVFMAADALPCGLTRPQDRETFRQLFYHELEAFFWGFCINTLRCLEHDCQTLCGIPPMQHAVCDSIKEISKNQSEAIRDTTLQLDDICQSIEAIMESDQVFHRALSAAKGKSAARVDADTKSAAMKNKEASETKKLHKAALRDAIIAHNDALLARFQQYPIPRPLEALRNNVNIRNLATPKREIQEKGRRTFRRMWPTEGVLRKWKLPDAYNAIFETLTEWHNILNCSLESRAPSNSDLDLWTDLYRLKKSDAETTGTMARTAARDMLRAVAVHFTEDNGQSMMEKLDARIEAVKEVKEAAIRNFIRKYPECEKKEIAPTLSTLKEI